MSRIPTLVRRELGAFFVSPVAYVVLTVFLAVAGVLFVRVTFLPESEQFAYGGVAVLLNHMGLMLLFFVPLLTMRLLAEEISSGTFETLMTTPVSNTTVVVSKFLGTFTFVLIMLLPSLAYPMLLYGIAGETKPDTGPIMSGYLGLLLLGMTAISVGVFVSACVRNQISAAVATVLILAALWRAGSETAGRAGGFVTEAVQYLGILYHFESFAKGVIDTRDVVYFISATALFLFAAVGVIAVRRWR